MKQKIAEEELKALFMEELRKYSECDHIMGVIIVRLPGSNVTLRGRPPCCLSADRAG
jgi:hypothetical protein